MKQAIQTGIIFSGLRLDQLTPYQGLLHTLISNLKFIPIAEGLENWATP